MLYIPHKGSCMFSVTKGSAEKNSAIFIMYKRATCAIAIIGQAIIDDTKLITIATKPIPITNGNVGKINKFEKTVTKEILPAVYKSIGNNIISITKVEIIVSRILK
jgi:hypothetical protein